MLKSEIIDSVVELMQDRGPAARGLVARWVNMVLNDLASRGLLESLQREEYTTLIPGNGQSWIVGRDYELAANTDRVFKVFVPAWGERGVLRKRSLSEFADIMLRDGATTRRQPEIYSIFGRRTLRIHPLCPVELAPESPADTERLYIWKYKDVEQLTEGDEITELTNKHTPLLTLGAYRFGARFDSLQDYVATKQEYEDGVKDFIFDQVNDLDLGPQTAYNDV